jgi:peptidoglycan-N-acetylglucosamine deacetylase
MIRASPLGQIVLYGACLSAIAFAFARLLGAALPLWPLLAALVVILVTVGAGVFLLPTGVFARPILAGSPEGARVAITFDDGPDPVHTRRVLDLLDARGHRATFFVIGARAERHTDVIAEIARRGHGLGNHSWEHSHLTPLRSAGRLARELARAGDLLERAAGVRPRWFRPPVGLISPPVAAAARAARLDLVGWSATARDGVASATVEASARRLLDRLQPGAILVLHDAPEWRSGREGGRTPIAVEILPRLLDALDARGLRSVPLDELLT